MFKQFLFYAVLIMLLTACSSKPVIKPITTIKTANERIYTLQKLTRWQVQGKMAVIQGKKRQSASLNWLYNSDNKTQELDLTTFLGINILSINTANYKHTVTVDGKEHHGNNLEEIIYRLTGMVLPTKALTYWIKGIPYLESDIVTYTDINTTKQISSYLQNKLWTINYSNYTDVNGVALPTQITLKQQDIKIKLAINNWITNKK